MIAFAPHNPVPDVQSPKKDFCCEKENQLSIFLQTRYCTYGDIGFSDSRLKNSIGIMIFASLSLIPPAMITRLHPAEIMLNACPH